MTKIKLSKIDKKILKMLLTEEKVDSKSSKFPEELGIPRTTYQRRLKYLKNNYIRSYHDLNIEGLDFRRVDLLIGINKGFTQKIGKQLLDRDEVILVAQRVGENDVDLRVEIIIHDNLELSTIIDDIKSIDGVSGVKWSEVVRILGRKKSVPDIIIDTL